MLAFFRSLFRSDSSGDRSPWGSFWFQPVGGRSVFGPRVNADTAMRLSTAYSCVRVLSESFAILPFCVYRPKAAGRGRTRVTNHWLVRLFTKRPNRFQNPFEFREMLQGHLVLRGNAYCQIVEDGQGGISELLPLHPDRVKVERLDNGGWRYRYSDPSGESVLFTRQEIWHIRGLSSDGIVGISPIDQQRDMLGSALATQDYASRFFANDAKPTGGWIEIPGTVADQAARDKLKESVQKATSGGNRHKTMILDRGMKYHEVGLTNKESQFLELRQFSRTEICAIWRVPPHKVGDLSRATFSNIEQQSIEFWIDTMLPWNERWEAAIESLLGEDDQDLEVVFEYRNLLRGDAASRAAYIHDMVLDGVLTRNEGRELEGYDPIDGLDEPLVPVNEQTLTESENPPEPVSPPGVGQPAKEQPDDGDEKAAARLAKLVIGNAARMARRIADGQPPSAAVLSDALAIPPALAASWLALMGKTSAGMPVETISASLEALGSTE